MSSLFITFIFLSLPLTTSSESLSGIQPLRHLNTSQIYSLLKRESIRPLLTAQEQESFLIELESVPPNWDKMHDQVGQEHGTRLFELNRQRDAIREKHPLLNHGILYLQN